MTLAQEHEPVFKALIALIGVSAQISSQDVGFFRALDSDLRDDSTKQTGRILRIISDLVTNLSGEEIFFRNWKDIETHWTRMKQVFDHLEDQISSDLRRANKPKNTGTEVAKPVTYARELSKPQNRFSQPVNNDLGPFKPLLTTKPHHQRSFRKSVVPNPPDDFHEKEWYENPYKTEIETAEYPKFVFSKSEPIVFDKLDVEKVSYIDKPNQVARMLKTLQKSEIIAVDLEHHDLRTYKGLLCLMQISTRSKDFVIDTLALRDELEVLNEIFCDPKILKIFHGAKRDILWLQRDLGLYVVSLFDTYYACQCLGLPRHSLAYLLTNYANFTSDKRYQLSDWRIRPLTTEMMLYAAADTHFLIYIFECLRNELIAAGDDKLSHVLQSSRQTATQRYENTDYNCEPGWKKLAKQNMINGELTPRFKALYMWRDQLARKLDESPRYIMTNQMLADLAVLPPKDLPSLTQKLSLSNHILKQAVHEIYEIVRLPERDNSQSTSGSTPKVWESAELQFSQDAVSSVKYLRKPGSLLVKEPIPVACSSKPRGTVDLAIYQGLFEHDDSGGLSAEVSSNIRPTEEAVQLEPETTGTSKPSLDPPQKRKLNIVDDLNNSNIVARKVSKTAKNSATPTQPFDFSKEGSVFKTDQTDIDRDSYRGFQSSKRNPKGSRNRETAQRAKSASFKRHK